MHTKNRVSSGTKATRVEICRAVRNEASLLFPRWRWWKLNAHGGRGAEDPERKVKVAKMWEPYSSQAKRKDTATGSCTFFWAVTKKMRCFTRKVVGTLFSHSCHNCLFCPSLKIHTHKKESFFLKETLSPPMWIIDSLRYLSSSQIKVTHLYPTLCHPVYCMVAGSSVQGILQAWLLEWVAVPSSKGSSQRESSWPRNGIKVSCIAGRFFTIWATREAPVTPSQDIYQIATLMLEDSEQDQVFGANELTVLRKESSKTRKWVPSEKTSNTTSCVPWEKRVTVSYWVLSQQWSLNSAISNPPTTL